MSDYFEDAFPPVVDPSMVGTYPADGDETPGGDTGPYQLVEILEYRVPYRVSGEWRYDAFASAREAVDHCLSTDYGHVPSVFARAEHCVTGATHLTEMRICWARRHPDDEDLSAPADGS